MFDNNLNRLSLKLNTEDADQFEDGSSFFEVKHYNCGKQTRKASNKAQFKNPLALEKAKLGKRSNLT